MSSLSQIAANQQNAQLSTGPTSVAGKAASSRNALKFGIYAQALIFPDEDPADLAALHADYTASLKPDGPIEAELVDTIVRSAWFGRRCDRLEPVIAKLTADPAKSPTEAIAALFTTTRNNPLHQLYRRRQSHQRDWFRALKELQRLQKLRAEAADSDPVPASVAKPATPAPASKPDRPLTPADIGFVFAPGPKSSDPGRAPAVLPGKNS